MADEPTATVRLRAPAGVTGVNWRGRWHAAVNGIVTIAREAEAELAHAVHGFTRAPDKPSK